MTFKQRLPFFLGGLTVGIIIVAFFLGKKNTTFDYGPNARLLKNIRIKERIFSNEALLTLSTYEIDTAAISQILKNGDADMWNKIKMDTCIQYSIKGSDELEHISIVVKNCDSVAFIEKITVQN
ncbi:DUF4258 domain-containing protein [Lutibacter sp.]|uniref:DUF4258 domain-containing protein n=1 Tax=Lutibacter sp. TaxID=1925666 RepID=UPI001A18EE52|nr:DUF4258 domain-containing protein [Lutibacter sp.]MBI9042269.1 DUF4258 domain-containing protein [Lutibacter sp.]